VLAISTIDEGIELLTGMPAGDQGADGVYEGTSFHGRVAAQLFAAAELRREFNNPGGHGPG
jgi:hypothetical protein